MILLPSPVDMAPGISHASKICCDEITAETQHATEKVRMQAVQGQLNGQIEKYFRFRGDPLQLSPSVFSRRDDKKDPKEIGDLFFERYRSGGSTDREIVSKIQKNDYCPYCGLRMRRKPHNASHDRDHVLPRSKFPEFSLLRANLVFCCDDCNDVKKDHYVNGAGQRIFIHPYFDSFLTSTVIAAKITVGVRGEPIPSFHIKRGLDPQIEARVQPHFDFLDLEARYIDEYLTTIVRQVETHRSQNTGNDSVLKARNFLRQEGGRDLSRRPNDPFALALIALADEDCLERLFAQSRGDNKPIVMP